MYLNKLHTISLSALALSLLSIALNGAQQPTQHPIKVSSSARQNLHVLLSDMTDKMLAEFILLTDKSVQVELPVAHTIKITTSNLEDVKAKLYDKVITPQELIDLNEIKISDRTIDLISVQHNKVTIPVEHVGERSTLKVIFTNEKTNEQLAAVTVNPNPMLVSVVGFQQQPEGPSEAFVTLPVLPIKVTLLSDNKEVSSKDLSPDDLQHITKLHVASNGIFIDIADSTQKPGATAKVTLLSDNKEVSSKDLSPHDFQHITKLRVASNEIFIDSAASTQKTGVTADEKATRKFLNDIKNLTVDAILRRIEECINVLPKEPMPIQAMVNPSNSRIFVIGDVHCSFNELLAQIQLMRELHCFTSSHSLKLNSDCFLVFTGDFADRGLQGTEVLVFATRLKSLNPNNVFLCRGNHETRAVAEFYGFFGGRQGIPCELSRRFPDDLTKLKDAFDRLFSQLPLAVFLGEKNPATGKIIFGMYNHAGLDKRAQPAIITLMKKTMEAPQKTLITCPSKLGEYNGLMWGDYYIGNEVKEKPSDRLPDVFDYTLLAVREVFTSLEQDGYIINFQARGHQHRDGGIFILDSEAGFTTLQNNNPIVSDQKNVFMFMCTTMMDTQKSFGLGQFNMNSQGQWVLTPYIMNTETAARYLQQFKNDFNL